MPDFSKTALPDSPLLRLSYALSYKAFERSFMERFEELPKPVLDRVLKTLGSGSIADIHRKTVLRLAGLLAEAGDVPEEAIAASMLYGAARNDPGLLRRVDGEVADYIEKFLDWEKRFEHALRGTRVKANDDGNLTIDKAMASAFARSVSGAHALTAEEGTLMKAWSVVSLEMMERIAGNSHDDDPLEAAVAFAGAIARQTQSLRSPLDDVFAETLARTRRALTTGGSAPKLEVMPG